VGFLVVPRFKNTLAMLCAHMLTPLCIWSQPFLQSLSHCHSCIFKQSFVPVYIWTVICASVYLNTICASEYLNSHLCQCIFEQSFVPVYIWTAFVPVNIWTVICASVYLNSHLCQCIFEQSFVPVYIWTVIYAIAERDHVTFFERWKQCWLMHSFTQTVLLELIHKERMGETIDRALFRSITQVRYRPISRVHRLRL